MRMSAFDLKQTLERSNIPSRTPVNEFLGVVLCGAKSLEDPASSDS